ncbi:MAG TPA: RDD family protein [Steroidobacteraceae bacterium]|jgi:uncharacterized RDD family membrane protein YckC|nr:RDD family protein [Steroidobacteraceae bacterium]
MSDVTRYAGFWIRAVASLIDSILVTMIVGPLLWKIYGRGYFQAYFDLLEGRLDMAADKPLFAGPADVLLSLVLPAIGIVAFWIARDATPGKMALSLKIVDAKTLGHMSKGQAIGRYLGYYVSIFPLGLGLLWVAFDPRKQGWHDKLAGTVVIRT